MRKRVFILTSEPPEQAGGVEHLVKEMMKRFEEYGYGVEVFHRGNCMPARLKSPSTKAGRYIAGALLGYFVGRRAQKQLADGVVAVISQGPTGWYPLNPRGHPLKQIHFYHGTYRGVAEAIRPFIRYRGYLKYKWWDAMFEERLSGRGKLCLCNSDQTRAEVKRFFRHDAVTVWLPLDTLHFRPMDRGTCRRELDLSLHKPVGLFVGHTDPVKGFPVVRALIQRVPSVQWVLALRGRVPEDLCDQTSVRIVQNASYSGLPLLYNAADFSLCPSRYEGFGYVVAEALACGTPVIAAPGGASRLFLKLPPMDRLLIENQEDIEGFRRAVSEVLSSPECFRQAVLQKARPQLEAVMGPEGWWHRFREVTGL